MAVNVLISKYMWIYYTPVKNNYQQGYTKFKWRAFYQTYHKRVPHVK